MPYLDCVNKFKVKILKNKQFRFDLAINMLMPSNTRVSKLVWLYNPEWLSLLDI